jgi:hypothetical protein
MSNHQCSNRSSVVACSHVVEGEPADVILCEADGSVAMAACFACAEAIEDENQSMEEMCSAMCEGCFHERTKTSPMSGPGFWITPEGRNLQVASQRVGLEWLDPGL